MLLGSFGLQYMAKCKYITLTESKCVCVSISFCFQTSFVDKMSEASRKVCPAQYGSSGLECVLRFVRRSTIFITGSA